MRVDRLCLCGAHLVTCALASLTKLTPARLTIAALAILLTACSSREFTVVSDTPTSAYEASLAPLGDGFVAAWYDTRDGHAEIYARVLDAEGRPAGPAHRLTNSGADAYEADVQTLRDTIVVGWYDKQPNGHLTPRLGAWTRDGKLLWSSALAQEGRNTVVRTGAGAIFAAWIQDEGEEASVWAGWWRLDGHNVIAPRRVGAAGKTTWNLNAAVDPAATPGMPRAWVAFDAQAGTRAEELFAIDVGETTSHVVQLTPDDGFASKYPDIGFSGDRVAIAWFDAKDGNEEVYLATGTREAIAVTSSIQPRRVTTTPGHSIGAYLAWNHDRLGLAWCDDTDGRQQEIFFQSFTAAGVPAGDVQRLTHTISSSRIPAIKPGKAGFALVWDEEEGPPDAGHGDTAHAEVVFRSLP